MTMASSLFFFNDPATTEIYTLSLHDALPIWRRRAGRRRAAPPSSPHSAPPGSGAPPFRYRRYPDTDGMSRRRRSEEHTSELQSRQYLVCRLLLEKKKKANASSL